MVKGGEMTEISFDTEGVTDCPMNGKAKPEECFGCNYCKVDSGDLIAKCIYENVFMNKPLEVDAFAIDLETLANVDGCRGSWQTEKARIGLIETVIESLDPDSKKRFEEYQEQNDPCR